MQADIGDILTFDKCKQTVQRGELGNEMVGPSKTRKVQKRYGVWRGPDRLFRSEVPKKI
jgi:hypothetical protein